MTAWSSLAGSHVTVNVSRTWFMQVMLPGHLIPTQNYCLEASLGVMLHAMA